MQNGLPGPFSFGLVSRVVCGNFPIGANVLVKFTGCQVDEKVELSEDENIVAC